MALVVLSADQKEIMLQNAEFIKLTKWSILDKFAYWKGIDGTNIVTAAAATRWARTRQYIAAHDLSIAESSNIVNTFVGQLIKNTPCWDNQVTFNADTVTTYLLNNNHFDAMADQWMDIQIASQPF